MKEKPVQRVKYKKGEKEAMIKAGFPLCFSIKRKCTHCIPCIKTYRALLKSPTYKLPK